MQFPITVLIIPLMLVNFKWVQILPITFIIDLLIHGYLFLYPNIISYSKLKNDFVSFLTGEMEAVDTPIIDKFNSVLREESSRSANLILANNTNVKVFKNSNVIDKYHPSTYPDPLGSTILVHKEFNENSIRDFAFLSHEFGHSFHYLSRQEKYAKPIICTLYQIITLLIAINSGNWTLFIVSLPINIILILGILYGFDSRLERNATLLGLQLIEEAWNSSKMHEAAHILLMHFVYFSTEMKQSKARRNLNLYIKDLADYTTSEQNQDIIDIFLGANSHQKLTEYELKDKLKNERLIKNVLINASYKESSFFNVLVPYNEIYLYTISLLLTLVNVFWQLKPIEYNVGWLLTIVSLITCIIVFTIYRKIYSSLWNKKLIYRELTGI